MPPRVVVLMLNWNQRALTLDCLRSLSQTGYAPLEIVVVDNGSTDGSPAAIREAFPQVAVVENLINRGCAGGRNDGFRYCLEHTRADFIFSLDNDTVADPGLIRALVDVAEQSPEIGVVGPKFYYEDRPDTLHIMGGGFLDWSRGIFRLLGQDEKDVGQYEQVMDVDFIPGGMWFIRRKTLEMAGLIDERYFIYFEDPDWCLRVRRAGFRFVTAPGAKVWHKRSSSFGMESPTFYYYRTRNRLLFMKKNAPRSALYRFWMYYPLDLAGLIYTLWRSKQRAQLRAALLGVMDFFRGRFGQRRPTT